MKGIKLTTVLAFSLVLAACGGGGGDDSAAKGPSALPEEEAPGEGSHSPGQEPEPSIELATAPSVEGMEELVPPGVPRLN